MVEERNEAGDDGADSPDVGGAGTLGDQGRQELEHWGGGLGKNGCDVVKIFKILMMNVENPTESETETVTVRSKPVQSRPGRIRNLDSYKQTVFRCALCHLSLRGYSST